MAEIKNIDDPKTKAVNEIRLRLGEMFDREDLHSASIDAACLLLSVSRETLKLAATPPHKKT